MKKNLVHVSFQRIALKRQQNNLHKRNLTSQDWERSRAQSPMDLMLSLMSRMHSAVLAVGFHRVQAWQSMGYKPALHEGRNRSMIVLAKRARH